MDDATRERLIDLGRQYRASDDEDERRELIREMAAIDRDLNRSIYIALTDE